MRAGQLLRNNWMIFSEVLLQCRTLTSWGSASLMYVFSVSIFSEYQVPKIFRIFWAFCSGTLDFDEIHAEHSDLKLSYPLPSDSGYLVGVSFPFSRVPFYNTLPLLVVSKASKKNLMSIIKLDSLNFWSVSCSAAFFISLWLIFRVPDELPVRKYDLIIFL